MCTSVRKSRERVATNGVLRWALTAPVDGFYFELLAYLRQPTTTDGDDPDGDDDDVQPRDFNIILHGWRVERAGAARSILRSRELLRARCTGWCRNIDLDLHARAKWR